MGTVVVDFELTHEELRAVVRYVARFAADVLPVFEADCADDPRPREAIRAARVFLDGAWRSKLQRVASLDAHRAAASAPTEIARLAAQAAGDAASAAYLHPIAKAHQVGHILRAPANVAYIAQLRAAGDHGVANRELDRAVARATPTVRGVLARYPPASPGRSSVAQLMTALDRRLRDPLRDAR